LQLQNYFIVKLIYKIFISIIFFQMLYLSASAQFDKKTGMRSMPDSVRQQIIRAEEQKNFDKKFSVSLGYGLVFFGQYTQFNSGSYNRGGSSNNSTNSAITTIGPIYAKLAVKMSRMSEFSLNVAYANASRDESHYNYNTGTTSAIKHTYSTTSVLARFNFYFFQNELKIFHPYWGFGLGWADRSSNASSHSRGGFGGGFDANSIPIGGEMTIGTTIEIYKTIFGYAEVGMAKSLFQGGLQYRF
jgi:hypothetical protein